MKDPFYIGYQSMPRSLAVFLSLWISVGVGILIGIGAVWALSQSDPGPGGFVRGARTLTGVIALDPYPILYELPSDLYPQGRSLLLVGIGKRGVRDRVAPFLGQTVNVSGLMIRRDRMTLLQLSSITPQETTETAPQELRPPEERTLAQTRLRGEITDGKCCVGAMRPGIGKKHLACANLCLIGGIPPLFITLSPNGRMSYFLLTDPQGNTLGDDLYAFVSRPVELEGVVKRRGNLLLFQVDLARAALL